jgi:hypothetical protein
VYHNNESFFLLLVPLSMPLGGLPGFPSIGYNIPITYPEVHEEFGILNACIQYAVLL